MIPVLGENLKAISALQIYRDQGGVPKGWLVSIYEAFQGFSQREVSGGRSSEGGRHREVSRGRSAEGRKQIEGHQREVRQREVVRGRSSEGDRQREVVRGGS